MHLAAALILVSVVTTKIGRNNPRLHRESSSPSLERSFLTRSLSVEPFFCHKKTLFSSAVRRRCSRISCKRDVFLKSGQQALVSSNRHQSVAYFFRQKRSKTGFHFLVQDSKKLYKSLQCKDALGMPFKGIDTVDTVFLRKVPPQEDKTAVSCGLSSVSCSLFLPKNIFEPTFRCRLLGCVVYCPYG